MRRGHYLEGQLKKILNCLNERGVHAHKNHPERTTGGVYIEGEPFDYEVLVSPPHCFDAKESGKEAWSLANAKPSQVKHLLNCAEHGAEAYFLVLFKPRTLRRFDVRLVLKAMQEGRSSLHVSEGCDWRWEELLSG